MPAEGGIDNVFGKMLDITVTPPRDYKYRVIADGEKVAGIEKQTSVRVASILAWASCVLEGHVCF